jgi:hypothetical protein
MLRCCATEATRQADQHVLDGRGAVIFGGEDLRVIGIEGKAAPMRLLLTQTRETLDFGVAVGAVHPVAGGPPLELRGFRRSRQGLPRAQQGFDVDTIVDDFRIAVHSCSP